MFKLNFNVTFFLAFLLFPVACMGDSLTKTIDEYGKGFVFKVLAKEAHGKITMHRGSSYFLGYRPGLKNLSEETLKMDLERIKMSEEEFIRAVKKASEKEKQESIKLAKRVKENKHSFNAHINDSSEPADIERYIEGVSAALEQLAVLDELEKGNWERYSTPNAEKLENLLGDIETLKEYLAEVNNEFSSGKYSYTDASKLDILDSRINLLLLEKKLEADRYITPQRWK